jgi:hypothetical protein
MSKINTSITSEKETSDVSKLTVKNQGNCSKCGRMANKLIRGMGACCASKHVAKIEQEHKEKQLAVYKIMADDFLDPSMPAELEKSLINAAKMLSCRLEFGKKHEHSEEISLADIMSHEDDCVAFQLERLKSPLSIISGTSDNFSTTNVWDGRTRYSLSHQLKPAQVYLGKIFAINGCHHFLDGAHFWTDNSPDPKNFHYTFMKRTESLFKIWDQFLGDNDVEKLHNDSVEVFNDLSTDDYFNWMAVSPASMAILNMAADPEKELLPFIKQMKRPENENQVRELTTKMVKAIEGFRGTSTYHYCYLMRNGDVHTPEEIARFKPWNGIP